VFFKDCTLPCSGLPKCKAGFFSGAFWARCSSCHH